jgi:hypothetical protein
VPLIHWRDHTGGELEVRGAIMADDNDARTYEQKPEPAPDLVKLGRLVGTWEMSGDVRGTVTYEWMEGGFFLIQHVDLE